MFSMGVLLFIFAFMLLVEARSLDDVEDFNSSASPYIRHPFSIKSPRYMDMLPYDMSEDYCRINAKCELLQNTACLGAKLPYHSTTLKLTGLHNQAKVQETLQQYEQNLRYIPKCWSVIQPFLCALYMPKCENEQVDLPSREMCRITLEPCKAIYNSSVFPFNFTCEDGRLYPSKCRNDIRDTKFNTTGYCMEPLIETDNPGWWFKDVEGCGLHCKDARYTENEHYQIHKLITYGSLLCIVLNIFTVTTFLIDWKTANRYPAKGIFYVNICFAISYGGYLIQFLGSDTREDIVCKKDGTLRKSEPSPTENLSCVIVFFMVYYFLIAGLVWFMIFSYAWYMSSLQALGKIQDRIDKKRAYFHLVAWSLPLMLTITTMAIGEIDGDYITGICFVGFANMAARAGLFLAPLVCTMLVSVYIIIRGLILLIKVQIESKEVISQHSSRKIQSNIVRMTVFTIFMVIFCAVTIVYHVYVASNRSFWQTSVEKYIWCKLTSFGTNYAHCKQTDRPSVAMLQLHLLAVFGKGIAMASWVWCDATLHAWGRYIRKKFHCEVEEPMKIQKHKIIARAFAGRKKFNEGGRVSIFSQNHTDPVGLQFELNSAASNELSTTWAKNLPRLVNRRPAVPNDVGVDNSYQSVDVDSDYSVNYRHVSIESRRNSGDSQVSVQIAELKATKRVKARRSRRTERHQFRRNSRNIGTTSRAPSRKGTKGGSTTSLDSHLQMLNALTGAGDVTRFAPNLNRRTATAGLDGAQIGQLLSNGKFILPPATRTCSEDENVSVTISETAVSMRVANQNMDLNDHFTISQLRHGLHVQHNSSSEDELDEVICQNPTKNSRLKLEKSRSKSCEQKRHSESSSCPEITQLVESSLNSAVSVGFEKNTGSRQSKTSIDVAVQANAHNLDMEMNSAKAEGDKVTKSKQAKTRDNKRFRKASKSKEKYLHDGTEDEKRELCKDLKYCGDEEVLIYNKSKAFVMKGSLQHSDRRELHDDYRFDPEDRRVGLKDQRVNEEPALNVPQHIQDVRADSRRSRIDAQDIRTDFREIRTELGGRREARLSGRFNLASRSDSKEGMSNVRRERQTRFNERQSDERTDSRNHRERFEPQLERARRISTLSRSEDRFNSRRNSRESNLPAIGRFNAERFNRRASEERANGQDSRRGRFDNERLDRRTLDSQRFSTRGNSQRRYINERSETRDNRRELRQNSRDAVRDNNQRRQNSERFDTMRSTPERTNRLLTQTRRNLNRESRRQETRIFKAQTSNNRREERSQENLNEARLRREDTHKAANRVDKARVAIDHQETSRSLENDRRVEVRSQSSRASEMSHRITDDDVKERTESQLALNFSQRDSRIGPSTLKNNSAVIVSTIQAALVLLLVLQMVANKAKQPFSNAFRFNTWTSMFSHVKSA